MTCMQFSSVNHSVKSARAGTFDMASPSTLLGPVPLVLDNPCGFSSPQPVTVGIPFPEGTLKNGDGLQLVDAAGRQVCLQTLPLAYWPDGSIKWLLLDFISKRAAKGTASWRLMQPAEPRTVQAPTGLQLQESPEWIVVNTGSGSFHLRGAAL